MSETTEVDAAALAESLRPLAEAGVRRGQVETLRLLRDNLREMREELTPNTAALGPGLQAAQWFVERLVENLAATDVHGIPS